MLGLGRRRTRQADRLEPRAALFFGLVATAFLWPALTIPDGVPSPSAGLYTKPPWQGLAQGLADAPDPDSGNRALPDVTYQIQPWLLLLKSQLRSGELPLWNPHSFLGQPFWANGQSAPLFPLHLLFAALPTLWGFLLLPWLRIVVGALGSRRLALALGVGPGGALLAGVAYPLSGMVTGNLLFPMANALALVPWVLWATERIFSGGGGWRPLAVCVALMALAGHPGTVVHCLLLSAVYLAVRVSWTAGLWRRLGSWLAGWATGGALAMVHLLPVALYLPQTARWGDPEGPPPGPGPPWAKIWPLMLRILQPWVFGRAEDDTWHGSFWEPDSRVFAGLVTLLLALVMLQVLWRTRRDWAWRGGDRRLPAVVVLLAFSALVAYRTPLLLEAVQSLPIVGRALHHRLLFGVDLGLALLAGAGLDRLAGSRFHGAARGPTWRSAALLAAAFAFLVFAVARKVGHHLADVLTAQAPWLLWLVVATLVLLWLPRFVRGATTARPLLLMLPALLLAAELIVAHAPSLPGLSAAHLYPPTPATDFLQGRPGNVVGVDQTLRPGTSMVYGLRDLRGDDPARPRRFDEMYRYLGSVRTPYYHPVNEWRHPWLDAAGVRWVLAPPGARPPDPSWRLVHDGDDARVFERPTARPEAWLADGAPGEALVVVRPTNSSVRVEGLGGAVGRLVVSQAWAPGWRARIGEQGPVSVETLAHDGFLLAVDLEHSVDVVTFEYLPPGLVPGTWISALALVFFFGSLLNLRRGTTRGLGEANGSAPSPPAV